MARSLIRLFTDPFRRSMRNKLLLAMVILSSLPVIAVTGIAADNNRKSMETEVIDTNLSNMKWTSIYLGEQFSQLNNLIYSILMNQHLGEYIAGSGDESLSSQFSTQKSITDMLTTALYSANPNVTGVELYLKERMRLFRVSAGGSEINYPVQVPPPYNALFGMGKDLMIRTSASDPGRFELIRSINRFENREKIGGVTLDVRWAMLDQTLTLLNPEAAHIVLVADASGSILYHPDANTPSPEAMRIIGRPVEQSGYVRTGNEYVFYSMIEPSGLKLVKIIPASFINHSAQATMNYGFIIGGISVLVAIIIAVFLAIRISGPLVTLARSMQGLGPIRDDADLNDLPLSGRIDEIGLLETKFLNMSSRIREHINTEYRMALEKQTAELKALQAQINPHFLQNTLQLIGSMLFTRKPEESYEIIKSLSSMFRYIIREPEELATLGAEIGHLNHYMLIQKQRYASRLRYTFTADKETLGCLIPKLTLQPVIENAFVHGLGAKTGAWELHVTIMREDEDVLIQVRDNGVGIAAERLATVRRQLESHGGQMWTSGSRIGLYNVASRIRMHFGERFGVVLDSEPAHGTLVTVRIPYVNEKGNVT